MNKYQVVLDILLLVLSLYFLVRSIWTHGKLTQGEVIGLSFLFLISRLIILITDIERGLGNG